MTINELLALNNLTANDQIPVWDAEATGSTEPTAKITAQNFSNAVKSLASLINTTEMNAAIEQSTASSVAISALSGYTIGMNRSRKIGDTVVLSFRVDKASGTIGTGWQDVAQISDYSAAAANMLCCPCNGYSGAMRVEINTRGKISVQNIDSRSTAIGVFVNGCL